jgi:hypothetical protein
MKFSTLYVIALNKGVTIINPNGLYCLPFAQMEDNGNTEIIYVFSHYSFILLILTLIKQRGR